MKKVSRLVAEAFVINDAPRVKIEVDHLDNNTGNDYYLNLEWVTTVEQQRRRAERMRLAGRTSSGYIGVSWHEKDKRWTAQVVVDKRRVFIGNFTHESHAARAYDDYVIDNHLSYPTNWNTELDC